MGTSNRYIRFARTAVPAGAVMVGVIAVGLALRSNVGWTATEMDALRQVSTLHAPPFDWLALVINWLFAPAMAAVLVLTSVAVVFVVTRRPDQALRLLAIVAIPSLGTDVLKAVVSRARPDIPSLAHVLLLHPGGLSFPSGHTSFASCFALGLIIVAGTKRRPLLLAVAAVVILATAASRVYLGVHYPSDVLASIVYSMAAVGLVNAGWVLLMSHWAERRSGAHALPDYRGASDAS
jgi:membrane-associated phospholipid phosphatase